MIKLLAVDMDGTCLDRRSRITDRTLEALRHAAASGITVVPATGRNLGCIPHRLAAGTLRTTGTPDDKRNHGLFKYAITSNGALVTDIIEKKTLFSALMPEKDALSLLAACRGIRLGTAAHICHRYLMQGRLLTMAGRLVYGRDAAGVYCVRNMWETVRESSHKVEELQFYFLSGDARKKLCRTLERYPDLNAAYTGVYAEVYSAAASKGNALAALQRILGITKDETACIGDGENDLPMFKASGLRIAMGNAAAQLKQCADYVTASNDRDGASRAIEQYIL